MGSKKYLIVVEKSYMARIIEKVYAQMKEDVEFDIDVAVANNNVIDINSGIIINEEDRNAMEPVMLNDRYVSDRFRVIKKRNFDEFNAKIKHLVELNEYAAIVNACRPKEEGDLAFQYTIESIGIEDCVTRRFRITSLTEDVVACELLSLND